MSVLCVARAWQQAFAIQDNYQSSYADEEDSYYAQYVDDDQNGIDL